MTSLDDGIDSLDTSSSQRALRSCSQKKIIEKCTWRACMPFRGALSAFVCVKLRTKFLTIERIFWTSDKNCFSVSTMKVRHDIAIVLELFQIRGAFGSSVNENYLIFCCCNFGLFINCLILVSFKLSFKIM